MDISQKAKRATFDILYNRFVSLSGIALYLLVMIAIYQPYRNLVPENIRIIWRTLFIITVSYTILQQSTYVYCEKYAPHLVVKWRFFENILEILFNFLIASMVVLFLPYADESLRVITIAVAVTYVPNTILSDPENADLIPFSAIIVMSATSYALWQLGGINYHVFAVIMLIYMIFLIVSVGEIKRVVLMVTTKRIEAEVANEKLAAANTQISSERDSKTRFIAAASHDLSQPLQAANLSFENLLDAKSERARHMAIENGRAAFQMASNLVSQMLNHLRLEADAVKPLNEKVAIADIFENLEKIYSSGAKSANIAISFSSAVETIIIDRTLLERALGNLIENSIVHSAATEITITANSLSPDCVKFVVSDNGQGIAEVDRNHIFDDYYQGGDKVGMARSGFGLGLSSVRRIASLLGGEIILDNNYNDGAKFELFIKNAISPPFTDNQVIMA